MQLHVAALLNFEVSFCYDIHMSELLWKGSLCLCHQQDDPLTWITATEALIKGRC